MPRPQRCLRILLTALTLTAVASLAFVFLTHPWRGEPARHASAPTLTPADLRTIERSLSITFPDGSILRHATFAHAKDSVFIAQIDAPAASLASWPGPPCPPFKPHDPEYASAPTASEHLPWAPTTPRQIVATWSDTDGTSIDISAPDGAGTVLIFLSRGGSVTKFPQRLRNIVPVK